MDFIFVSVGLFLLYYGGEFLVTGCVRVSSHFKISPFIIGATVIGFGTSSPELAVSILAALRGSPELSMGNVIGSNIANAALVLGLTALVIPLSISERRLKEETPALLLATFLILYIAWDLEVSRAEGLIMIFLICAYLWHSLSKEDHSTGEIEDPASYLAGRGMGVQVLLILTGLGLLVWGADLLVEGGVHIAQAMGVSEWFIGISIIALGTSLPEIFSSLIAAKRGHGEMAIGNVFGSNIFNILMVLGMTASIHPLHMTEPIHPDLIITALITCLLLILIKLEHNLSKKDGFLLISCYVGYLIGKGTGII